jgi:phage terminase large subunit
VYGAFKNEIHVKQRDRTEFQSFYLAMDEGYTNPAVILAVGKDADGRLHILREFYQAGKLQSEIVSIASQWQSEYQTEYAAVDAAAAGLIADLRNNNINAQPHKGRVLDGIAAVQNLLKVQGDGRPRLSMDPCCANLINEFESYVWRSGKDEPVKEFDHALDAMRYLVISQTVDKVQIF